MSNWFAQRVKLGVLKISILLAGSVKLDEMSNSFVQSDRQDMQNQILDVHKGSTLFTQCQASCTPSVILLSSRLYSL